MDSKPLIVVVEDEELLLNAIAKKMALSGLEPVPCSGAMEAFAYLKNAAKLPDAIWLDYYLSDMEGVDFMKKLISEEKYRNIPVVVVSNSLNADNIDSMLSMGVKKFLPKSEFRLDELINTVKEIINGVAADKINP